MNMTIKLPGPTKPKGWCVENGIDHAWEPGPTLTSNPPIPTRYCKNCGQRQYQRPAIWEDNN